jgi:predicted MFS family arabinose efflux permease
MWRPRAGLLADRDYRQLFLSTTASQLGFQITQLALPLVAIIALQATEFQAGLIFSLMTAAFLVIGLPAGAWVDRMRRRSVLIVGDLARAAVLISVPVAWWAGVLTMWQVYLVAVLFGVCTVFFEVAYQSYLPHLVGRENLVEGNAKLESVRAVSQVVGPGAAGQLVQLLTAPVAVLVNAVMMGASALFVARIRKREARPERRGDAHLLREVGEGLRFVLGHRLLRAIAACTGVFNLFFGAYLAMLAFFLAGDLALDAGTVGLIFAAGGAGGVLGALVARRFAGLVGQGPAIWMSAAFAAPFGLLVPLAEPGWRLWLAAAGLLAVWMGAVAYNVVQVSFRQALTPDHLLGRMNATMRFLVWGTMPVGGMLGAVLGDAVGARTTLTIAAVGTMFAFLPVLLSPLRGIRELPRPTGDDEPAQVPA